MPQIHPPLRQRVSARKPSPGPPPGPHLVGRRRIPHHVGSWVPIARVWSSVCGLLSHCRWVVRADGPARTPGASRGCSCAAPLVLAACCTPTAGGLRSASACAKGFTTDFSAFESVSHPSALKRLRVYQGLQPSQTFAPVFSPCPRQACAFAALRGARRGRRAACLAVYRARQPLACGCGWRELPVGTRARCGEAPVGGLA